MPVISAVKDPEALTLTITARFDAPIARVWEIWTDPRRLERWWGPPRFPATVTAHDLTPGGRVTYFMTGPDGARYGGWFRIGAVDPPRELEFEDGFADADGNPIPGSHTAANRVTLTEAPGGGTVMVILTAFSSPEAMEQAIEIGMDTGMAAAVGQVDALLARAQRV